MDTITTIPSLLTCSGSAQPVTVALTPSDISLIAAAPELLEALGALASWVERAIVPEYGPRKPMPENCRIALDASRTAIAKATGAQP